jgi:hypothetical protein
LKLNIEIGFLLLQQDVVRPIMLQFLSEIVHMDLIASNYRQFTRKAFISYAWPPEGPERSHLQNQLIQLVQDMKEAHIDVTLDILSLRVGTNISEFMHNGISMSDAVLWIGSPVLKARIKFKDDGVTPDNPATEEFVYIQAKAKSRNNFLFPLWFAGDKVENAYPCNLATKCTDFRNERKYLRHLPFLIATILNVASLPSFSHKYAQYLSKTRALESTFTDTAISKRLEKSKEEFEQQQSLTEIQLQQLVSKMPVLYQDQQAAADEAQLKGLNSRMKLMRTNSLSPDTPHARELALHVPLKGGKKPDAPPSEQFDVLKKVQDFVSSNDESRRVLLILGTAGSGKSLYARLIEKRLWRDTTTGIY